MGTAGIAPQRLAAAIAAGVLLPVLVLAVTLSAPADGTVGDQASLGWKAGRMTVSAWFGPPGSLQAGDEVVAVAGAPLSRRAGGDHLGQVRPGDRLTYTVLRPTASQPRLLDVTVTVLGHPVEPALRRLAPELPLIAVTFALYAFVLWRRPDDPTARALFAMAVLLPLSQAAAPLGISALDVARGRLWPYLLSDVCNVALWGVLLRVVLLFPTPPPLLLRRPRLLLLAHLLPVVTALPLAVAAARPGIDPLLRFDLLAGLSVPAANVVPPLVVAVLVTRYLTSRDPLTRGRMRWALAAVLFGAVAYLGLGQLPAQLTGQPLVPWAWQGLFLLPCPIALGAAVLRHRLFDIEVVLRRSLVYGGLTVALGLVYLSTVTLLGQVLGTQGLTPIAAAAAVTALFHPLRDRLRRTVSRLVFGNRDDPGEVLHGLGTQLEAAGSAADALPHLLRTLTSSLRLSYAALELDADPELSAATGRPSGTAMTVPLIDHGEEIGRLVLDPGAGREPFGPRDRRLVEGLARQVTVVAQNQVLTRRLRRSLERTVSALEEERRRLRRDVHDGLGPTLASAALRADLARRLLRTDPDRAEELLAGLAQAQRSAIREMRTLVEGLRPAALDQLGLAAALTEQAQGFTGDGPLTPRLEMDEDLDGLPAAVEVAAYRIATEALTNVARHAGATRCAVRLRRYGTDGLVVQVGDDGRGLGQGYRAGVGLTSMRERATALGGRIEVGDHPGGGPGTLLTAWLPGPAQGVPPRWLAAAEPDRLEPARQLRPLRPPAAVPAGGTPAMTESGSPGQVRPTEDPGWTAAPELPDADADEQRRDLIDDPEDADPETVAGRDPADRLAELPLEVSEADLAEQLADVPFDEDADRA